jgi:hypothetical protein
VVETVVILCGMVTVADLRGGVTQKRIQPETF